MAKLKEAWKTSN